MYQIEPVDKELIENSEGLKCFIEDLKLLEENQSKLEQ